MLAYVQKLPPLDDHTAQEPGIDEHIIITIIIIVTFIYEVLISGVQSFAFHEAAAGAEHVIVSTAIFHTKNCQTKNS